MNWGYKILFLYTGFIAGILFLVYKCTQENIDLVTPDYYERELKFQDQIDRSGNIEKSGYSLTISYNESSDCIDIMYPPMKEDKIKGEILFFKPDNSKLDFTVPVQPLNGKQSIPVDKLVKGYWKIQTTWEAGTTPLYQEEKVYIQ